MGEWSDVTFQCRDLVNDESVENREAIAWHHLHWLSHTKVSCFVFFLHYALGDFAQSPVEVRPMARGVVARILSGKCPRRAAATYSGSTNYQSNIRHLNIQHYWQTKPPNKPRSVGRTSLMTVPLQWCMII